MAVMLIGVLVMAVIGVWWAVTSETGTRVRRQLSPKSAMRTVQEKLPSPSVESILRRGLDKLMRCSLTIMGAKIFPFHAVFEVNPKMFEQLSPAWSRISRELSTEIDAMARAEGWEGAAVTFSVKGNPSIGMWEINVHPIYPDADDVETVYAGASGPRVVEVDEPTEMGAGQWEPRWLVELPDGSSHELRAGKAVIVGKSSECDITVASRQVSRRHVRLFWAPAFDVVEVEDLDSTNGTVVGGQRLRSRERVTVNGDTVIGLGSNDRFSLVYRAVKASRR